MNFTKLPLELKIKIQSNFDSVYDFVNYCQVDKKTKKFCIDEYKLILKKKGYIQIPSDKIIEKLFNMLLNEQKRLSSDVVNLLFFGKNSDSTNIDQFFDEKIIPFLEFFIIKGDSRYNLLFGVNNGNIYNFLNTVENYAILHFKDKSNSKKNSLNEINKKIKKLKFIKNFFTNLYKNDSDFRRYHLKFLITVGTIREIIGLLEKIKKDLIKKYIAIGAATVAIGTATAIGVKKIINKRKKTKK